MVSGTFPEHDASKHLAGSYTNSPLKINKPRVNYPFARGLQIEPDRWPRRVRLFVLFPLAAHAVDHVLHQGNVITSYSIHYTKLYDMKRETSLPYKGPDGKIYAVYFKLGENVDSGVITSYSIHYTKLYEPFPLPRKEARRAADPHGSRAYRAPPGPSLPQGHP